MTHERPIVRAVWLVSALSYVAFWASFLVDLPSWLRCVLFAAGVPSVTLAGRRRRESFGDDSWVPDWLAFRPWEKIAVVALGANGVAGLFGVFGASWWPLAGVAAAIVLWVALPRDPLPDPLDRPPRSDEPPFRP